MTAGEGRTSDASAPLLTAAPGRRRGVLSAKSNAMYRAIFVVWLGLLIWLAVSFAAFWAAPQNTAFRLASLWVSLCFTAFLFYALYHYALVICRRTGRIPQLPPLQSGAEAPLPSVAVLYTTVDDFRYDAAQSCLRQDYPNFHLFLVDASQTADGREHVKAFHADFPDKTSIWRRATLEGFKARSLNAALAQHVQAQGYEFFALCDNDGLLPRDFLARCLPYLMSDDALGFVQANHDGASSTLTHFVKHFLHETRTRWEHNNVPRNRYGLPLLLGHGATVRTRAWEESGGFPEVVAEDVAFTIAMRAAGYSGLFAEEIVCSEGIPETLAQNRKRTYRMTAGDFEAFRAHAWPFIRRARATLAEKADMAAHTLRRPTGALFLPALLAVLLAAATGGGEPLLGLIGAPGYWGLVVLSWLIAVAPLARVMVDMRRTPLRLFRHAAQVVSLYTSFYLHTVVATTAFLLAGKAYFIVTGAGVKEGGTGRLAWRQRVSRLDPNHPRLLAIACGLSAVLAAVAVLTGNLALLGIALAMLSPLLQEATEWKSIPAEATGWAALLLIIAGSVLGPLDLVGPQWQFLLPLGLTVLVRT